MAATDHHLGMADLEQVSKTVAGGEPIKLDPASHQMLLNQLRESGVARMLGMGHPERELKHGSKAKPWWKLW